MNHLREFGALCFTLSVPAVTFGTKACAIIILKELNPIVIPLFTQTYITVITMVLSRSHSPNPMPWPHDYNGNVWLPIHSMFLNFEFLVS